MWLGTGIFLHCCLGRNEIYSDGSRNLELLPHISVLIKYYMCKARGWSGSLVSSCDTMLW